jgi:hypothetical protein
MRPGERFSRASPGPVRSPPDPGGESEREFLANVKAIDTGMANLHVQVTFSKGG